MIPIPLRMKKRDKLKNFLTKRNIQTLIHYPIPPHKQQAYKELNNLHLPITEKIHNEVLSIPMSSVISDKEVENIISVINTF